MAPIIETRDLTKSHGHFGALHGLDFSVPEGSVFALLGASGAGKTTAIKILLNVISPTRDKAMILGVESRALGPGVLAKIGYVSENQVLPARLRVDDFFDYLRIPGADQDWLIRPLNRTHLLLAKLAFVALTISVPMFVSNLLDALATGFPLVPSLKAAFFKDVFVFACFVVPAMALAATTRNMTELVIIGAALVVAFSLSLSLSALVFGADWCPTCNTGMSWLQHIVQHIGILVGAGVILGLQYYRRRSDMARALAAAFGRQIHQ